MSYRYRTTLNLSLLEQFVSCGNRTGIFWTCLTSGFAISYQKTRIFLWEKHIYYTLILTIKAERSYTIPGARLKISPAFVCTIRQASDTSDAPAWEGRHSYKVAITRTNLTSNIGASCLKDNS